MSSAVTFFVDERQQSRSSPRRMYPQALFTGMKVKNERMSNDTITSYSSTMTLTISSAKWDELFKEKWVLFCDRDYSTL